jgi:hypothetical protein
MSRAARLQPLPPNELAVFSHALSPSGAPRPSPSSPAAISAFAAPRACESARAGAVTACAGAPQLRDYQRAAIAAVDREHGRMPAAGWPWAVARPGLRRTRPPATREGHSNGNSRQPGPLMLGIRCTQPASVAPTVIVFHPYSARGGVRHRGVQGVTCRD